MTPNERAAAVGQNATGPILITRYACDSLEACIAEAIREAVAEEREACAKLADALVLDLPISHKGRTGEYIRNRGTPKEYKPINYRAGLSAGE